MMFLKTIAENEATGRVAEIYEKQKASMGFSWRRPSA
jgi:hypothetical protein